MSEGALNGVWLGRQSSLGTAVTTTTRFPVDAGFLGFELDRATESPNEDFGSVSREYAGRSSHGVRWATASMPFVARFEDIVHMFEMHVAKISGGTPTGTASPYTWTYTFDDTTGSLASALKPYTLEYGVPGSTQDEWRATGVIADSLELGFDALTAPGNSMWKGTAGLVAVNRAPNTVPGTAVPASTLETMEGHLTALYEGPVGTAYASLSELGGSLKSFSMTSNLSAVGRAYGGTALTSDIATDIGRSDKANIEFTALIGINSTSKTDIHDIYAVSGPIPTDRRWRIKVIGTGVNAMTIDARVAFRSVQVGENEDERLYEVNGVFVRDSTLSGRGQITLTNAVATIP